MARATIGLPVRNGEATVERAIRLLQAQTERYIRILVSENASTDSTLEKCRAVAASDDRVTVFAQPTNIGMMPNFVWLVEQATTPYFMWAAHDDEVLPICVEQLAEALDEDPDANLAVGAIERISPDGESEFLRYGPAGSKGERIDQSPLGAALDVAGGSARHLYIYGLWRTDFLKAACRRYPTVAAHDRLFITQVVLATPVLYVDEVVVRRHVSPRDVVQRYGDERVGAEWTRRWQGTRYVTATVPYIARSAVVPWWRKPFALLVAGRSVLVYARWTLRRVGSLVRRMPGMPA